MYKQVLEAFEKVNKSQSRQISTTTKPNLQWWEPTKGTHTANADGYASADSDLWG